MLRTRIFKHQFSIFKHFCLFGNWDLEIGNSRAEREWVGERSISSEGSMKVGLEGIEVRMPV